ncbi:outer membrane beta-barrel protein [Helicobacter mastomyrinus]|uniref:Outer membrane beta-barrel protein n=1 Tax=Helicobacter mastomyrinus TaxID=287948 RepID=A0ABZ3F5R6_9HELI|nr:outer membrane beta-barrel protein [uncultured Helicobacter sp.]
MNYGVNIDALYNFIDTGYSSLGAFLGVGVGANTWSGVVVDEIENVGLSPNKTGLDVSLNVGLRSVIHKRLSLEAIIRVPLLLHTLYSGNVENSKMEFVGSRAYNVGSRYIINF